MTDTTQVQTPAGAARFKVRKATLPLFSMVHRKELRCQVLSEVYAANMPGLAKNADETVDVCEVADLENGEVGLLITNAIVKGAFMRSPGGYVGHFWQIECGELDPKKGYRHMEVSELIPEDAEELAQGELEVGEPDPTEATPSGTTTSTGGSADGEMDPTTADSGTTTGEVSAADHTTDPGTRTVQDDPA